MALRDFDIDSCDVASGGHLNPGGDLANRLLIGVQRLTLRIQFFEVYQHGRGLRDLAGIHDLDDPGQTLSHVHGGHSGVVEGAHRHLRAWLPYGLGSGNANGLVRVGPGAG